MPRKSSSKVGSVTVKGTRNRFRTKRSVYSRRRSKRVKPPKPVPPPKPYRPKRGNLKRIYRDLLSSDRDQRVTALAQAMEWYDHVIVYVFFKQEGKVTTNQYREKNLAERSRATGIADATATGKESAFTKAIQHYEKVVAKFNPPLLKHYTDKYKEQKPKLEARARKLRDRYKEFLELIKKAFQPKNNIGEHVDIRVNKLTAPYRIDGEGNVILDRKIVFNLRKMLRRHGLLPVAIQMFPVLSEAAARMPQLDPDGHPTGRMEISNKKRYTAVLEMMNSLVQYEILDEAPRKLVRRVKRTRRSRQDGTV